MLSLINALGWEFLPKREHVHQGAQRRAQQMQARVDGLVFTEPEVALEGE